MSTSWEDVIRLTKNELVLIKQLEKAIDTKREAIDPMIEKLYERYMTNSSGLSTFKTTVGEFIVYVESDTGNTVRFKTSDTDKEVMQLTKVVRNMENKITDKEILNNFKKWINSDSKIIQAYFKTPTQEFAIATVDNIKTKILDKLNELSTVENVAKDDAKAPKAAHYRTKAFESEYSKFNDKIEFLLKEFVKPNTDVAVISLTLELLESSLNVQTLMMKAIMNK